MTTISDEMLMSYVDGQLAPEERVRVETYLATDPEARARMQVYVDTGPALARALDEATCRPMPAWLIETVRGSHALAPERAPRVGTLPAGGQSAGGLRAAIGRGVVGLWPVAAGAFATMLVGVGIGWNLNMTGAPAIERQLIVSRADGQLQAGAELRKVLETSESGRSTTLAGVQGRAFVTPVMTFESHHAAVCRQYRVGVPAPAGSGPGTNFEGIACRAADGTWRIDVHTPAAARRLSPDRITPASGSGDSIVDAAIDRMISGDAFSRDEESRRLRKTLTPPSPDQSRGGAATGN